MTKQELRELRERFRLDVVFGGDPDSPAQSCFLAAFDARPCDGRIEAAHWINRQRIRNSLWARGLDRDLIELACWDTRLAVPACTHHHRRFDHHATPALVVPRQYVPVEVEQAAQEWGLQVALEQRSPFLPTDSHPDANLQPFSDDPRHIQVRAGIRGERSLFGVEP